MNCPIVDARRGGHIVRVGTGGEIGIRDLAALVCEVMGFTGELTFNPDMPDGAPRKYLDNSRMTEMGWSPTCGLREGLERTYAWYLEHIVG